jgi:hypothetical protein
VRFECLLPFLLCPLLLRARVVGWPPVRSYRKNALADVAGSSKAAKKFVKVAVDGAPYLRKVDLEAYDGYDQLLRALQDKFFAHFTIRQYTAVSRCLVSLCSAPFHSVFRSDERAQGSLGTTRGSWWTPSMGRSTCRPTRTRTATGCSSVMSPGSEPLCHPISPFVE